MAHKKHPRKASSRTKFKAAPKTSKLRILRLLGRKTQEQISQMTGINISRISLIESGKIRGTQRENQSLFRVLGYQQNSTNQEGESHAD